MQQLPLTSLVGLDTAVQALLLLAVEPRLGGVVFAAPAGTGKSSLARGFAALVAGEQNTPHSPFSMPAFVELPASADEEALLGGLDLEATLRTGQRHVRAGLFARAHGGCVYADQINLLSNAAVNTLLGAMDTGDVLIEREGISARTAAHFSLIGSYDPAEGQPRRHLLDRIGLWVCLPATTDAGTRAEVVRRNIGDERRKPKDESMSAAYRSSSIVDRPPSEQEETDMLRGLVAAAREQLPRVVIADEQLEQLAAAALAFGVEGHRTDMFAAYVACANAALGLRDEVEQDDLELALRLVIMPRATRIPEPPADDRQPAAEKPPQPQENREDDKTDSQPPASSLQPPEEQVFAALITELPVELEALPFKALRRGKTGSRGSVAGKRGQHIRSTTGDLRRNRIDIPATLRAAAPWQALRQEDKKTKRQEDKEVTARLELSSAVRRPLSLELHADDIRVKQYKSKAGALFLFAVDASGSMALHRMRQAKGAVHALLQRAYVHRDRVALLSFRGEQAELLLPPSQSVELARRALDLLPTGGGTPIAAALLAALDVAKQARGRGIMQTVLVLLSDGRANIGLRAGREGVAGELQVLGRHVAEAGIHAMVVDTQRSYLSRGEARKLAEWLGGQYIYLPNAQGEQIADMAASQVTR